MKTGGIIILSLLLAFSGVCLADWEKPKFCKMWDCPKFEMVKEGNGYDTRKYDEALFAWTCSSDVEDMQEAVMKSYAMLFAYFHGANEGNVTIPMTVPVVHVISFHEEDKNAKTLSRSTHLGHRHGKDKKKKAKVDLSVGFYMPYAYQDEKLPVPKPTDKEIGVSWMDEKTLHVRDFSGWPTSKQFMKHYEKLEKALDDEEEDFATEWAALAVYDPPTVMEDRHNEVFLDAEGGKDKPELADWIATIKKQTHIFANKVHAW